MDLETSFKLINNSFKNYLDKIIYTNNNDICKLNEHNNESTIENDTLILKYTNNFTYMAHSMNGT